MNLFRSASGTRLDPGMEFVETVRALLHANEGDPATLDEFGDLLANDVGTERVRAVVDDALKQRLRQFSARLDDRFKGSQWLRLFLTPLGQLPYDTLEWSWNQRTPSALEDGEGLHFVLGAALSSAAIVGRTAENDLQYRFDVIPSADGQIGTPFHFRGSTEHRPRGELEFRFEHPSQVLLQDALANDLPRLANALEPEQLPDSNLKLMSLEVPGQVLLASARSTQTSWSTLRNRAGAALQAPRCITAPVQFELEWAHSGRFKLQIRPDALHGTVIATLVSIDSVEPARVLSFGSNVTTRGLERVVRPLLAEHMSAPADLVDLAERFSRPCGLMQEHLEQTLNERPALAQELRGVLLAGDPAGNTSRRFNEQVSMDTVTLLDEREVLWAALLKGECAAAVEFLLARLDVAGELRRFARAVLRQWLAHASEALRRSLCEELEEVLELEAESARALGSDAPLQDGVHDAGQLLEPCVEFIARVRRARQQLLDAAEAAVAEALALELGRATQRNRDEDVLLELTLNPRHDAAREAYARMMTGDFRPALELALEPGQPHVTLDRGVIAGALTNEQALGFCFDIIDSEAEPPLEQALVAEHRVGGAICVRLHDAPSPEHAHIGLPAPLALAADASAATLAVSLGETRRPLGPALAQRHLRVLESAGVIAAGSTASVSICLAESEDHERLRMDVLLPLSRAELERACARDGRDVERVTIEEQMRIVDACLPDLRGVLMGLDDHRVGDPVAFVQSQIGRSLHRMRHTLEAQMPSFSGRERARPLSELVHTLAVNAERMSAFLRALESLWSIEIETPRPGRALSEKHVVELEAARMEIDHVLRRWGDAPSTDDAIMWGYAFLTALRRLCGIDRSVHPLMTAMGWRTRDLVRRELTV